MKTQPIRTFRSGAIGVSIWQRDGKRGTFYEFTLSRSYLSKEKKSGYTGSFRIADLPALRGLLDQAAQWILEQHVVTADEQESHGTTAAVVAAKAAVND